MITVSDALNDWLMTTPFVAEALARDLINLSALARDLRPMLEKKLMKDLSDAAVMMSLKRLKAVITEQSQKLEKSLRGVGNMMVRSGLGELTYRRSESIYPCQKRLLQLLEHDDEVFVTFTQGVKEMTLVISESHMDLAREAYRDQRLIKEVINLAAITIRLDESVIFTPGIHYSLLKPLAWSGINIVEVVSTYSELTIILAAAQVDRSFSLLMKTLNPDVDGRPGRFRI